MIYHTHHDCEDAWATLDDLHLTVAEATSDLLDVARDFDTIVVTGISGLVVGAPVALALNKPLAILRKQTEDCHETPGSVVNERRMGTRLLFLDDFVAGGDTLMAVENAVRKVNETRTKYRTAYPEATNATLGYNKPNAEITHIYLYRDRELRTPSGTENESITGRPVHPDACDRCRRHDVELYYNEVSGLSVCETCDNEINEKETGCPF